MHLAMLLPPLPSVTEDQDPVPDRPFVPWDDNELLHSLYQQLRSLARARLQGGGAGTLSPTVLVNEALLRLLNRDSSDNSAGFRDESHFVGAAATAMRHVAVDYARRKATGKRHGSNVSLEEQQGARAEAGLSPETVLHIDGQLERLRQEDNQLAAIVELRVFGGLTFSEIGSLLNMPAKTAERRWQYAAALLRQRIGR